MAARGSFMVATFQIFALFSLFVIISASGVCGWLSSNFVLPSFDLCTPGDRTRLLSKVFTVQYGTSLIVLLRMQSVAYVRCV